MKFSIIIPTYNRASLVGKAIQSVLAQTYTNWELIIIDDGSTDTTKEVIAPYLNDSRVKYIYQQNAERCVARNNGIKHATGDWICFLDSDDYYLPDRLSKLIDATQKCTSPSLIITGISVEKEGELTRLAPPAISGTGKLDYLLVGAFAPPRVCVHSAILQKHLFDPRFKIGEDTHLWLRIAAEYPVIELPEQFTVVTVEHSNRSISILNNPSKDYLVTLKDIFGSPDIRKHISTPVKREVIAGCYVSIGNYYVHLRRRMPAIIHYAKAIILCPTARQIKTRVNVLVRLCTFCRWGQIQSIVFS